MDLLSKVPRIIPTHPHSTRLCGAVLLSLRVCMQGASCAVLCTDGAACRRYVLWRACVHGQTNSAGPLQRAWPDQQRRPALPPAASLTLVARQLSVTCACSACTGWRPANVGAFITRRHDRDQIRRSTGACARVRACVRVVVCKRCRNACLCMMTCYARARSLHVAARIASTVHRVVVCRGQCNG